MEERAQREVQTRVRLREGEDGAIVELRPARAAAHPLEQAHVVRAVRAGEGRALP